MNELCNSEEWLAAYLDKRLSEEERHRYEMHLSTCQSCLADLIAAKAELDEMAAEQARAAAPVGALSAILKGSLSPISRGARAPGFGSSWATRTAHFRSFAVSFSLAVALILSGWLFLLMLSPGWDPQFITGKSDLARILAMTDIGEMRISRGPTCPVVPAANFRGVRHSRTALMAQAALSLQQAGARHPGDWRPFALLGDLSLVAGRLESADVYYQKALRLHEGDARLLNDLAVAAYRRGDPDRSRRYLDEALAADHPIPETTYNLAIVCKLVGKRDAMKHYLETYLRLDPSSPWAEQARTLLTE